MGSRNVAVLVREIKRLLGLKIMEGMTQKKRVMRASMTKSPFRGWWRLQGALTRQVHIIQEKVTRHVDVPRMQFIDNAVDVPVGRPRQVPNIQKTVECIWIWW